MRKKILGIIAVTLTASVLAATLTGCGTRAKATDQEATGEETIIVTDDESSEDATVSTEDETTATEVVEAEKNSETEDEDVNYTEHEYFFAYDKQDKSSEEDIDMSALNPDGNDFELEESVNLYGSGRGYGIGYTKPNISVHVTSSNDDWYCIFFENEQPEYQYVLVKAEDFIASAGIDMDVPLLTYEDVRTAFEKELNSLDGDYIVQDEITDDMESVEFTVPIEGYDVNLMMQMAIMENRFENYKVFALEQVGEPDVRNLMTIRFYFK